LLIRQTTRTRLSQAKITACTPQDRGTAPQTPGGCHKTLPETRPVQIPSRPVFSTPPVTMTRIRPRPPKGPCGRPPGCPRGRACCSATPGMDTRDYSLGQQIDALAAAGCHKIFADTEPGRHSQYPELRRLLDYARPGDALVVASLTRLSRSLHGLIPLVAELQRHGVELAALHENLDTATPGGRQIFHVFAALADFLREPIAGSAPQRRRAAGAGGHAGRAHRHDRREDHHRARLAAQRTASPPSPSQIGVSRGTLYAHMDALTAERNREPRPNGFPSQAYWTPCPGGRAVAIRRAGAPSAHKLAS